VIVGAGQAEGGRPGRGLEKRCAAAGHVGPITLIGRRGESPTFPYERTRQLSNVGFLIETASPTPRKFIRAHQTMGLELDVGPCRSISPRRASRPIFSSTQDRGWGKDGERPLAFDPSGADDQVRLVAQIPENWVESAPAGQLSPLNGRCAGRRCGRALACKKRRSHWQAALVIAPRLRGVDSAGGWCTRCNGFVS